ncbi:L-xylulose reductase-like [Tetranychus urticae]|uniref:L-xylulose reductase-like n=1 Tax=Tetranychus urticae TaxID=32264 RepID=UPI000D64A76E|nr:L-xylulose reductase-like [Tetranychus urticae]
MQINVRAVVLLTELAAPHLVQAKGAIVNVSSIVAIKPFVPVWSYCMSKAALDMFTKCMAGKLAPHVRVNSVNPGTTRTSFARDRPGVEEAFKFIAQALPLKRVGEPIDLANSIAFLASDAARNMTGSIVVSDSGMLIADPYAK